MKSSAQQGHVSCRAGAEGRSSRRSGYPHAIGGLGDEAVLAHVWCETRPPM